MKDETTRTRPASAPIGGIGPGAWNVRAYVAAREERRARRG